MDTLVDVFASRSPGGRSSPRPHRRRPATRDSSRRHGSAPPLPEGQVPVLCGVSSLALDPHSHALEDNLVVPTGTPVREVIVFCRLTIDPGVVLPDDSLPVGVLELPWRVMVALDLEEDQQMDGCGGHGSKMYQIRVRTGDRDSAPFAHPDTCKKFEAMVVLRCPSTKGVGVKLQPISAPESP